MADTGKTIALIQALTGGPIDELKSAIDSVDNTKLDAPSTPGTATQVLVSDGEGGQVWGDIDAGEVVIDSTLSVAGAAADAKAAGDAVSAVRSAVGDLYYLMPTSGATDWEPYSFTVTSGYIDKNGAEKSSQYAEWTSIVWDGSTSYKVSGKMPNNATITPVVYVDSLGNVLGYETSIEGTTVTNHVLTIPSGTATIYINWTPVSSANPNTMQSKAAGMYVKAEAAIDYTQYTWNAVGDSITYNGYYMAEVNSILGLPYKNEGLGASTLAINDTYMEGESIVERVCGLNGQTAMSDADVWTVMGGLNDCLYDSPLGQLAAAGSTFDKSTVYGALQAICEYILNLRAHPRLILITPTQSVRDTWSSASHPTTMAMIRQAVIDVAEYYSVTVFDAWAHSGISAYNIQKQTNPTTSDGVHLNTLGADILGEKLSLVIKDELFGINDD